MNSEHEATPDEIAVGVLEGLEAAGHVLSTPLWGALHSAIASAVQTAYASGVSDTYLAVQSMLSRTKGPN